MLTMDSQPDLAVLLSVRNEKESISVVKSIVLISSQTNCLNSLQQFSSMFIMFISMSTDSNILLSLRDN